MNSASVEFVHKDAYRIVAGTDTRINNTDDSRRQAAYPFLNLWVMSDPSPKLYARMSKFKESYTIMSPFLKQYITCLSLL